ncbi:MAG: ribonuclease T [Sphingomonadales bacterium]|nr:MAG: ribonuclease T [Sphingomonadales bacterium]
MIGLHRKRLVTALAAAAALFPGLAAAQANLCVPPKQIQRPQPDLPTIDQPSRVLPIGSYTLALTWSPGFCRANGNQPANRFQCGGSNRFGFTLHGLWPDGVGKSWPQYCTKTGLVPDAVIRATMCSTPSAQLIQHEWAKHGTCMPGTPADYFDKARGLYGALRYPDMAALSRRTLTVGQFKAQFAAANPAVPASAMRVTLTRQNWLDEVWLCLDTRLRYARCRPNTGGAPDAALVKIWRGGKAR